MRRKDEDDGLDPKQDQLILSLLHAETKEEAADRAGIARSTMYRWFGDPRFLAAYRAARRQLFDDALAMLEKTACKAVQALAQELDEAKATGSFAVIAAASRILDKAFKAQSAIAVEEELSNLRTVMAALKAGQPPAPPVIERPMAEIKLAADEQAEATRLRVAWMSEIGNSPEDIDNSLRYNRPQSVAEEEHLLGLVRKMMELEKANEANLQDMP